MPTPPNMLNIFCKFELPRGVCKGGGEGVSLKSRKRV